MKIKKCPSCSQSYEYDNTWHGQVFRCQCGNYVFIPKTFWEELVSTAKGVAQCILITLAITGAVIISCKLYRYNLLSKAQRLEQKEQEMAEIKEHVKQMEYEQLYSRTPWVFDEKWQSITNQISNLEETHKKVCAELHYLEEAKLDKSTRGEDLNDWIRRFYIKTNQLHDLKRNIESQLKLEKFYQTNGKVELSDIHLPNMSGERF